MKILKFGGTSVGSAESIKQLAKIVQHEKDKSKIAIIVSAFSGVTNQLIELSKLTREQHEFKKEFAKLVNRHHDIAKSLFKKNKDLSTILKKKDILFDELAEILHGVYLVRECSGRTLDFILSFGERLSAQTIAEYLNKTAFPADFCDARDLIVTDDAFGDARVNFSITNKNIKDYFKSQKNTALITGFIASSEEGVTTTLGRGGSDYTAAILAAALNAKEIQIWTDVNGVLTANPSVVKSAFPLKKLTYDEAMELSHFGAKVLHPPTIQPALEKNIPIRILNTFNPDFSGTYISNKKTKGTHPVTGLTAINEIALLTIQGSGMFGVPGVSARLFQALAAHEINVILISQASSEHSICVAVKPENARRAQKAIEDMFKYEIKAHEIEPVRVEKELSVIAAVGQNMRHTTGLSGKFFNALGKSNINVIAIAQGSSELNISVIIKHADLDSALNVLHKAFFDSFKHESDDNYKVYLAGAGQIGSELLVQIRKLNDQKLSVYGISNSQKMIISDESVNLNIWKNKLRNAEKSDPDMFAGHILKQSGKRIFVDCSASEQVSEKYSEFLKKGIHIVTANKIANTKSWKKFKQLKEYSQKSKTSFLYETNVGAGLPVIKTIQDLLKTGDKVSSIEAVLSGTLSYLFNNFDGSIPFSRLVKKAHKLGYTEPDPRLDLGGKDMARKLLILARECGKNIEMEDVRIEPLLSKKTLNAKNTDHFFELLKDDDKHFEEVRKKAEVNSCLLRFTGEFDGKKITLSLKSVGPDNPFYGLKGSENSVAFYTERYNDLPMVIKGPGAGAAVTAAGVLNDIITVTERYG